MKKIGLICLAVVIALGALGVGYALWSDTVEVITTVNTGTVSVALSQYDNDLPPRGPVDDGNPNTNDWYNGSLDPSEIGQWQLDATTGIPEWIGERYPKNVASTDSTYDNTPVAGPIATITVENAYPSYWSSTLFDVQNTGTIPVRLYSVKLIQLSRNGVPVAWNQDLVWDAIYQAYVLDPTQTWDFEFRISTEAFGSPLTQIEPGNVGYFDVDFHLLQGAEQNTLYDFVIQLVFANWNE